MGIYIKGMRQDLEFGSCKIERRDDGLYLVAETDLEIGEDYKIFTKKVEYPLVPVLPHGRLIDADALYEDCALDHGYEVMATTTRINEYMQLKIDGAPTIIPAEEGET